MEVQKEGNARHYKPPVAPPLSLNRTASEQSRPRLVPTADEIAALPRPARVAFAARCARRVLPTVAFFWKGAPAHHLAALAEAVRVAELADRQAAPAADAAALDAYTSASTAAGRGAAYEDAARAALFVVSDFATGPDVSCSIDDGTIVRAAASVLLGTATTDTPLTAQLRCVRRDFNRLRTLARKGNWTDDTPVPPEVFGPLWPEGVEPHWAADAPR